MSKNSKLVVIGGDAAGMSAASKVRRTQKEREIVVFERGRHTSYAACGMPYFIAGQVPDSDRLIARKPEAFRKNQNIDVRIRHEVVRIDVEGRSVVVRDLEKDTEIRESWGELLIATGAMPVRPDLPGMEAEGVFSLSILQTGIDVYNFIEKNKPQKAVVVGGGYIGIEMAEALLERGMEVSLVDMAPQVMATMDGDMASLISDYMREEGVDVHLEEKLERLEHDDSGRVTEVVTDRRTLPADLVITGIGIQPNSGLAKEAGLELGVRDAIRVDKRMQTTVPGIWAAGDCAESHHLITGEPTFIALGTVANKHGVVAGTNISGGDAEFPGVLGTAITKFNDMEIARTGLSEKEAKSLGRKYKTATIEARTRSGYYPGSASITVKLVAEEASGRLLGGQIVGMQGAGKRIDTIATALTAGMTARNIMDLDLSYAPPFSPVWDPVQIAARKLA